jgi:hypothetical protein
VPPQHNPYAQPSPYGPQAQPAPPYYGAPPPGAPGIPGAPGAPRTGGGAGKAVLWAVVGAVIASAAWGGAVYLLKDDSTTADLRGYEVKSDLCGTIDLSAFKATYPQDDTDPGNYTTKGKALDDMSCSESLEYSGSTYGDAYLYVQYSLHKKTDPGPEFTDTWLGYKQHSDSDYVVTPVTGFGDEAYLITEDTVVDDDGNREVTLAVRDGWMTYSMDWSQYASSYDSTSVPTISEATRWVKTATTATLTKLKG